MKLWTTTRKLKYGVIHTWWHGRDRVMSHVFLDWQDASLGHEPFVFNGKLWQPYGNLKEVGWSQMATPTEQKED